VDRPSIENAADFIRRHTRLVPVPLAPEIRLHLADEVTALWRLWESTEGDPPMPYWAFAWAGGQALARYLLDHPGGVLGRTVIDLGAGSGLVGIAAALAGAARVFAAEIDPYGQVALGLNAGVNNVALNLTEIDLTADASRTDPTTAEVIVVGDLFYEERLAATVLPWLQRCRAAGSLVLVGDPGRAYLPADLLEPIAEYDVTQTSALEDAPVKRAIVWSLR
jgi:predicted nicotinamide N-methyase